MLDPVLDFEKILKALTSSLETVKQEQFVPEIALKQIENAKRQFQQALSYNLQCTLYVNSSIHG